MKKILLIEDNADVRENTAEILSLAGYEVTTAPNGKVGVDLATKTPPDLIVCDIMMPELDGYGVLHILSRSEKTSRIPFIFLTAKAEKSDLRKGMNLGADDYLTKPFEDTDLLNAIEVRLKKNEIQKRTYAANGAGLESFIGDARKLLNLDSLCRGNKVKVFKKKSEIFSEGDTPSHVFFINAGNIKTVKAHPDGKELITNLYATGDFFGYESLIEGVSYPESAVALEDAEIVLIPKEDFIALMQKQSDVAAAFISMLCKKVADKEEQLLHLAYNSVRQRTAEALVKLHELDTAKQSLGVSREDLSKLVGTATESVIRVLSDFKEEGLIQMEGTRIKIASLAKLGQVVRWNVAKR